MLQKIRTKYIKLLISPILALFCAGPGGGLAPALAATNSILHCSINTCYKAPKAYIPIQESAPPPKKIVKLSQPAVVVRGAEFIHRVFGRPYQQALRISQVVWSYSYGRATNYQMILAVMATESGFQPRAVSYAGCVGLMQVNSNSIPAQVRGENLASIRTNIQAGVLILKEKLAAAHGSWAQALAYYNGVMNPQAPYVRSVYSRFYQIRGVTSM